MGRIVRHFSFKQVLIIGMLIVGASTGILAEEFSFQYQKIINVERPVTLSISNHLGKVEIIGHDSSWIVIEAVKRIKAGQKKEASDLSDRIEIRVDESKDLIAVSTNYLNVKDRSSSFWKNLIGGGNEAYGAVEYTIRIPRNCRVKAENGYGGVVITRVDNSVEVQSGEGGVTIDQIVGDVTVRNSGGDILLGSIEGSIDIGSSEGVTRGELLFGSVTVRQPAGSIDLQFVQGDIRIKSSSAQISIRQEAGSLDLASSTGKMSIKTNLESNRDFIVQSESGDIELVVPESSSGALDIRSETGSIRTEVPVIIKSMSKRQLKGEFGTGGVKISLVSTSGNVTVAQF
jgi:hypothetical protein